MLHTFSLHSAPIQHLELVRLSGRQQSDRSSFLSISKDRSVGFFSLQNMNCKHIFSHSVPVVSVRLRLDQDYLLVECLDESVCVWELSTGKLESVLYGESASHVLSTCEDSIKQPPKTIQTRSISNQSLRLSSFDPPFQVLWLNIKLLLQDLHEDCSGRSCIASSEEVITNSYLQMAAYRAITYLIPWKVSESLDKECETFMHLQPPQCCSCIGLRGYAVHCPNNQCECPLMCFQKR